MPLAACVVTKTCRESGDQLQEEVSGERLVICLGSDEKPIGKLPRSITQSPSLVLSADFGTPKTTRVPSGEVTGITAPPKVRAESEGAAGKRAASTLVTSSFLIVKRLRQVNKPSFLISTS